MDDWVIAKRIGHSQQLPKAPAKQAFVATLSESSGDEECLMIIESEQGQPQAMLAYKAGSSSRVPVQRVRVMGGSPRTAGQ